ncbi:hypothetical protein O0L34_g13903 [Tuta absoluta]|nr:hypothetical protein O0L34_g13903 [Tuta absoluta]
MITELTKRKWACVEKASLAFGIIDIIASIVAILTAMVPLITVKPYMNFLVSWVPEAFAEMFRNETLQGFEQVKEIATTKSKELNTGAQILVFYILRIVLALILLMFSALLIAGVYQRRSGFIKAFFYYGVCTLPIALLLNLLNIADCIAKNHINIILWIQVGIFFAYMFYMIQLVIVRKTFQKFDDPENLFAHTRLQESVYPAI